MDFIFVFWISSHGIFWLIDVTYSVSFDIIKAGLPRISGIKNIIVQVKRKKKNMMVTNSTNIAPISNDCVFVNNKINKTQRTASTMVTIGIERGEYLICLSVKWLITSLMAPLCCALLNLIYSKSLYNKYFLRMLLKASISFFQVSRISLSLLPVLICSFNASLPLCQLKFLSINSATLISV